MLKSRRRTSATNVSTRPRPTLSGAYTIPNLIPGDYEVSAEASGFSKTVSKVTLTVGAKQEMNFSMTVGQVTQTVEVTGAAPQVELASSTISGVVESTQIVELPLNGRDWASLATAAAWRGAGANSGSRHPAGGRSARAGYANDG